MPINRRQIHAGPALKAMQRKCLSSCVGASSDLPRQIRRISITVQAFALCHASLFIVHFIYVGYVVTNKYGHYDRDDCSGDEYPSLSFALGAGLVRSFSPVRHCISF